MALEFEYLNLLPPLLNTATKLRTTVIDVTTSSARHDLTTLLSSVKNGHYIEMTADGCDVYYAFNDADSGSVDETAQTSGVTACAVLFDGAQKTVKIFGAHTWLILKGSTDGSLRINIASIDAGQSPKDV
jgi:hypothetical protein